MKLVGDAGQPVKGDVRISTTPPGILEIPIFKISQSRAMDRAIIDRAWVLKKQYRNGEKFYNLFDLTPEGQNCHGFVLDFFN